MVDSSIGGKVAVNLPSGKNLVGSFYHPEAVLIDPLLLNTLPDRHFSDGMAEVIKHGCICDRELFDRLKALGNRENIMKHAEDIICRNCDIKRQVVQQDEWETGLRMILNFGHTFGHAIEKFFRYEKYTHGEAVAMGMVFAAELSSRLGYCTDEVPQRIRSLVTQYHLPADWPEVDPEKIKSTVLLDKKAQTNELYLVLIKSIGEAVFEKFPKERVGGWIDEKYNH
jgi:3-dehydroquinate synthase